MSSSRFVLGSALALAVLGAVVWAEDAAAPKPMACCQQMMQKHRDGLATLDAKAATMNAAQGAKKKLDAMAAVVNELVAQHRAMHGADACPGGCPMMEHGKHAPAGGVAP